MPALPSYIPSKQSLFGPWLTNFSTLITAAPASYGLTAADAANIAGYLSTWNSAYLPITSPSTKTAAAVAAKNNAFVNLLPLVRGYAQTISNNVGVSSSNKIALGLNPKTSVPTPITAPASNPVLFVQSAVAGQIILRYRDSAASPSVKAKPYGVLACRIRGEVSATPITEGAVLPILATATKSPFVLSTSGMAKGSVLYLAGDWVTRRGLASGVSPVISTVVV
jgi:hypothetical protein